MCGLAGIVDPHGNYGAETARRMGAALVHRGPDDEADWQDSQNAVFLSFRRLSVLDLSAEGNQPMHAGPLTILFNGEIYNHRELRLLLETQHGQNFQTATDTEILLKAFAVWGVQETLRRINGMYAVVLLDRDKNTLSLMRDRFGEKPLYHARKDGAFLFASELKALRAALDLPVSREGLNLYLRYGFIPAPATIHDGVFAVRPGQTLTFNVKDLSLREDFFTPRANEADGDFEMRLAHAVDLRLRADVKVGVFLSGGVDSSLLLALAGGVPSFTLRMHDDDHDESQEAAIVAQRCGSVHRMIDVDSAILRDSIAPGIEAMDQPLADAAFFPTYLLAREARRHVTVALSGEGGDELQAGYTRHRHESLLRIALKTGVPSFGFERFAPAQWRRQIGKLQSLRALETSNAYQTVMSLWNVDVPELAYKGFRDADTDFYLPHDLLMKLDGATMAHALEGRCPYLDPDLWGAVNALPRSAWQNKRQARALLHKYGLADVTSKGKKGLTLPLAAWLRRDLRDWAEEHLKIVAEAGILPRAAVEDSWRGLISGASGHAQPLWALIVLAEWCKSHETAL